MTNEEKQLLLIDLCARLPYGVICQFIWTYSNETTDGEDVIARENDNIRCIDIHTEEIQADYYGELVDLEHCKPYLRPMSSITDEEDKEFQQVIEIELKALEAPGGHTIESAASSAFQIDFYNKRHIDYRGLIPMGLALEAPEDMYKIESL